MDEDVVMTLLERMNPIEVGQPSYYNITKAGPHNNVIRHTCAVSVVGPATLPRIVKNPRMKVPTKLVF